MPLKIQPQLLANLAGLSLFEVIYRPQMVGRIEDRPTAFHQDIMNEQEAFWQGKNAQKNSKGFELCPWGSPPFFYPGSQDSR